MDKIVFNRLFKGVNGPEYRGAAYPNYIPNAINESAFNDNLRFKEWEIDFDEDEINLFWMTQGCFDEDDVYDFLAEVSRCIHDVIGYNNIINVEVISRNGEECGYYLTKLMPKNN